MQFQSVVSADELTNGKSSAGRISDSRHCEPETGRFEQLAQYSCTGAQLFFW